VPDGTGPWLADVGFGRHSVYPLRLDSRAGQDDPAGRFLLADAGDGDVDVLKDRQSQYRIEVRERSLADFAPTCWWQQRSPARAGRGIVSRLATRDAKRGWRE
jgi:N-hydroxyarylamine O-acetyltransferase